MKGLFIVMLFVVIAKYSCGLEVTPASKAECDCSEYLWDTDCPCNHIEYWDTEKGDYHFTEPSKSR